MLDQMFIAAVSLTILCTIWVIVQRAWTRTFREADGHSDALSGRGDCSGCGQCQGSCSVNKKNELTK